MNHNWETYMKNWEWKLGMCQLKRQQPSKRAEKMYKLNPNKPNTFNFTVTAYSIWQMHL